MEYNFPEIEKKWQNAWRERKTYKVYEDPAKQKFYVLDMFPYPSGAGLHVGHPLGYIASDIFARYKRHRGFNVLHPMGYDSFGLPAEQYAIQTGQHPAVTTANNIARYREQLDKIGFCYDWDREVRTSDPDYYEWTQWIFALIYQSWYNKDTDKAEPIETLISKFEENGNYGVNAAMDDKWYENLPTDKFFFGPHFKGEFTSTDWKSMTEEQQQLLLMHYRMAYLADSVVNWCPALGTVLANDEIKDGVSERGGHPVVQKKMRQWSMRISAYAERLLKGLETIDWSDSIKEVQRNWIGRSEGALVRFDVAGSNAQVEVFTTRPDTIFGVSFMTLAPEHDLVPKITTSEYREAVEGYIAQAKLKTERDRQAEVKNVTGQFTGAFVIHPFTGEKIPVWIGDYVLAGYGTGAVMAVPAGDQRDYDFAKKFDLPIPAIFKDVDLSEKAEASKEAVLMNSQMLDGLSYKEATPKIIAEIEKAGIGEGRVNYRMRDAVFSRQRYWGEPFPVYYNGEIPYICDMEDLPIELPEVDKYLPTESGEPPLARASGWGYHPSSPHPQPLSKGEGSAPTSTEQKEKEWYAWQTANSAKWEELKSYARSMRANPTKAEDIMWQALRANQIGFKIRRQHSFLGFIVDFICIDRKLVIEIDGKGHNHPDQIEYDHQRTYWLNQFGYKVIRFTNNEVLTDKESVIRQIKEELASRPSNRETKLGAQAQVNEDVSTPLSLGEGLGVRLEYNTMPGWAGSSWYFLRYMDPHNGGEFASREKTDYWGQVDLYMGGAEHGTGHLLYSRFWTKILFDRGYIGFDEPFKKMINQGMITGRSSMIARMMTERAQGGSILNGINVSFDIAMQVLQVEDTSEKIELLKSLSFNPEILLGLEMDFANNSDRHFKLSFSKSNVNISYVDSDVLNVSELMEKDSFLFKDNKFLLNKDGKFICGWEIEKMSKSKLNVQTPDELVEKFGADTLRCYEMFLGPVEQSKPWDTKGINGVHNFLRKFWRLYHNAENEFAVSDDAANKAELKSLHKTIKKVTEDLDRFSWNTCISAFMICVNELQEQKCNKRSVLETLCILLSPFAPHIAEEIWEKLHEGKADIASVTTQTWPAYDEANLQDDAFDYPVSFNGKTRYFLPLPVALGAADVEAQVRANEQTAKYLEGKEIKKIIVVPKRIVNVVV